MYLLYFSCFIFWFIFIRKNNNERYYYIRDALGNILGIISQNGQIVVQYSYTSYGVCSISGNTSLGNENPFRYKGYYYDVETGLYYLTTRYYDPEIGRFISPDSVDYLDPQSINGLNLYAYCNNDPVNYCDPSGHFAILSFLAGLGISALIGAVVGATAYTISEGFSYAITGEWSWSWAQFVGNTLGGALGGALSFISPASSSVLIGGLTGFSSTAFSMILQNQWEGTDYSVGQIIGTSVFAGFISAGATGLTNAIKIPGLNSGEIRILQYLNKLLQNFIMVQFQKFQITPFRKC